MKEIQEEKQIPQSQSKVYSFTDAFSKQIYLVVARAILVFHFFIMAMFLVGAILVLYVPLYIPIHIALVSFTALMHLRINECILTRWEKKLLNKARGYDYPIPCYRHYMFRGLLGIDVSNKFAKHFLIYTKIIPAIIPLMYLLLRYFIA